MRGQGDHRHQQQQIESQKPVATEGICCEGQPRIRGNDVVIAEQPEVGQQQDRKELRGREDGGGRSQSGRKRQDQETEVERLALDAGPSGTERHLARMNRGVEIERHKRDSMCKTGTQREAAVP